MEVVSTGAVSFGKGGNTGAFLGGGGILDKYNFLILSKIACLSYGTDGGGGTTIEFLLMIFGSSGGATLTGATGAVSVVSVGGFIGGGVML